jgi:hypothetical protein
MKGGVLLIWALPLSAFAQPSYLPFRVPATETEPFKYYLDSRTRAPAGLDINFTRPAIEAAWGVWNQVTCAMPKARSQGFTQGAVPNPGDRNDAFSVTPVWVSSIADPDVQGIFASGMTLGLSVFQAYGGVLTTCDTYLNGFAFRYAVATSSSDTEVDVQTVIMHEAGHCLGLDHFGRGVMNGAIKPGDFGHQLTTEEVQALCDRNPARGRVGAECFADGGCDDTLRCLSRNGNVGPLRYCANACVPNTQPCLIGLECRPSNAFPATMNACQYTSIGVTTVGRACMFDNECGSGVGRCIQQFKDMVTDTERWVGGYCSQTCEVGQPVCPSGSTCLPTSNGQRLCVQTCRVGLADCRANYACDPVGGMAGNTGICVPECKVEQDCLDPMTPTGIIDYTCRVCDGRCVPKQTAGVAIGTFCQTDQSCGVGQICRPVEPQFAQKQCTLTCGRGCGNCPAGAVCVADARGELFCLKSCAGQNSCSPGQRCKSFQGAQACVPECQMDSDCALGETCVSGQCEPPTNLDGGPFTNVPDAGRPFMPRPDAGIPSGGGSAGCACTANDAGVMLASLLGAWLFGRRRRR